MKPFAQIVADHRVYDVVPDASGFNRDSRGITATVGSDFRLSGLLTGAASVGYTWREYVDPQLENIGGLVADASLRWEATGLTTVELGARTAVGETTYANASGDFIHEVSLEVEHAFRRWLIGTASVAYRMDDYEGSGLTQRTFTVGAGPHLQDQPLCRTHRQCEPFAAQLVRAGRRLHGECRDGRAEVAAVVLWPASRLGRRRRARAGMPLTVGAYSAARWFAASSAFSSCAERAPDVRTRQRIGDVRHQEAELGAAIIDRAVEGDAVEVLLSPPASAWNR